MFKINIKSYFKQMTKTAETNTPHAQEDISELVSVDTATYEIQKDSFIANRIAQLETQTPSFEGAVDSLSDDYTGFLTSEIEVKTSPNKIGFRLDDPEMYGLVLDEMRYFLQKFQKRLPDDSKGAYFRAALYATQAAQKNYFGNVIPGDEQKKTHHELVLNGGENIKSVADFKNIGLCVQRSAVANNLLQFLGVPTTLKYGELEYGYEGKLGHTFLLVETPRGNTRLYDPMIPRMYLDETGKFL